MVWCTDSISPCFVLLLLHPSSPLQVFAQVLTELSQGIGFPDCTEVSQAQIMPRVYWQYNLFILP
jgi:hypothetical protein